MNRSATSAVAPTWPSPVLRVDPDPVRPKHSYAVIVDYLPFDNPVPFSTDGKYAEARLRAIGDRAHIGAYLQGKSVREIPDADFASIVRAGLTETLRPRTPFGSNLIQTT